MSPGPASLTDLVLAQLGQQVESLDASHTALARATAAVMVDSRERPRTQQPTYLSRRLAVVSVVNAGPPVTADVTLGTAPIPGASPQSTYYPVVGDLVWLEFSGPDAHISPPLTTEANRAWLVATLLGAWVSFGSTRTPSYWRDPVGVVHLKGAVKSGANNSTITNLPASYRIPVGTTQTFPAACMDAGGVIQLATVTVDPSGDLTYIGPATPTLVDLSNITYRVD